MPLSSFFIYLGIMAGSTYLIRAIPFALMKKKVTNRFIQSFLTYIPYAVLAAMTVPSVFYATDRIEAATAGLAVAILLALRRHSLLTVAAAASAAVYVLETVMSVLGT